MKFTFLGKTGLSVSKICLGTGNFSSKVDEETSLAILDYAYDNGLIFWDTSDIYGREDPVLNWHKSSGRSEKLLGSWINKSDSRDDLVISSKSRWPPKFSINYEGLSRKHLRRSIKSSLEKLQTDYIDIYFAHGDDQNTSANDVIRSYNDMITNNEIHNYGLSNFQNYRISKYILEARYNSLVEPTVLQYSYSLTQRAAFEYELPNLVKDENLGTMAYAPLDTGFLGAEFERSEVEQAEQDKRIATDKIKEYQEDQQKWDIITKMKEIASELEVKPAQIALSWLFHQSSVNTIVLGVSSIDQLRQAIDSLDVKLSQDQLNQLTEVSKPSIGSPWWHNMYTDNYLEWIDEMISKPIAEGKYTYSELLFKQN